MRKLDEHTRGIPLSAISAVWRGARTGSNGSPVASQLDAIRQHPEDWARYTTDAELAIRDGIA